MDGGATGTVTEALRLAARLLRDDARRGRGAGARDPARRARQCRRLRGCSARRCRRTGDDEAAERAELDAIAVSVGDPELMRAAEALVDNDLAAAEHILRPRLKAKPTDVAAIRMMAELAGRLGRYADAENLLRRALELAPAFAAGARQSRHRALQAEPARPRRSPSSTGCRAPTARRNQQPQGRRARPDRQLRGGDRALRGRCSARFPDQPKVWMSYGHILKTVGRQADSIAAYRRAHRRGAGPRRGLVEPRQSEDGRVRRGRHRGDGGRAGRRATSARRTASTSISRSARRMRIAARPRPPSAIMPQGNRAAPRRASTTIRTRSATMSAAAIAFFTARLLRRAARARAAPPPIRSSSSACRAPARP